MDTRQVKRATEIKGRLKETRKQVRKAGVSARKDADLAKQMLFPKGMTTDLEKIAKGFERDLIRINRMIGKLG